MNEGDKHKILAGDWVIRVPADPPAIAAFEMPFPGMGKSGDVNDYQSGSRHAVFVLDATQHHLTIFDPLAGQPSIIVYDRCPGDWYYATFKQVEITWQLARFFRPQQSMSVDMEIRQYPYTPLKDRNRND